MRCVREGLSGAGSARGLHHQRRGEPFSEQSDPAQSQERIAMMAQPEKQEAGQVILSRREALVRLLRAAGAGAGTAGIGAWLSQHSSRPEAGIAVNVKRGHTIPADPVLPEMAIIEGEDPAQLARQALAELGGMQRFVSRGDIVLVKPNIGWD